MSDLHVEVCTIDKVEKHPNADRLSIATVKGWTCVTGLDQFEQGQVVVYLPPDSIIPASVIEKYKLYSEQKQEDGTVIKKTYFKTTYADGSARMTTQKLRSIISQGLILPLSEDEQKKWLVGMDVAKDLGIKKWEPEVAGYMKGAPGVTRKKLNPLFDKYTNIENIKNYNKVFKDGDQVKVTEKIHGTNSRYGNLEICISKELPVMQKIKNWFLKKVLKKTHEFVYGSHNVQLGACTNNKSFYGDNVYATIAKKYKFNEIIPEDYIIYGEIYGKGIQDLEYGLNEIDFVAFDIKYKNEYVPDEQFEAFCNERNIPMVPILYKGAYDETLLETYTTGKSTICPIQIREGCVFCDLNEARDMYVGRKILKSISPDYLTRKNATEYH
jgi:RNA ligase (TIGR02306 family)